MAGLVLLNVNAGYKRKVREHTTLLAVYGAVYLQTDSTVHHQQCLQWAHEHQTWSNRRRQSDESRFVLHHMDVCVCMSFTWGRDNTRVRYGKMASGGSVILRSVGYAGQTSLIQVGPTLQLIGPKRSTSNVSVPVTTAHLPQHIQRFHGVKVNEWRSTCGFSVMPDIMGIHFFMGIHSFFHIVFVSVI